MNAKATTGRAGKRPVSVIKRTRTRLRGLQASESSSRGLLTQLARDYESNALTMSGEEVREGGGGVDGMETRDGGVKGKREQKPG